MGKINNLGNKLALGVFMGKYFDSRPYAIHDFAEWDGRKELILAPAFQRRSVWTDKARSYLIDTIIRGLPIPKIYMRQLIDPMTRKSTREIIDGQQRLRTILDFVNDGFKVLKTHNIENGGLFFSQLDPKIKADILRYEISTDLVLSQDDSFIFDIFARLNTYTVPLNRQEMINAKYFGDFKQTVYSLGRDFYTFWTKNDILSNRNILRMEEAELVSELVIAMIDGIQYKNVIESYYKKYDDDFPNKKRIVSEFQSVMNIIGNAFENGMQSQNFQKKTGFYTLFCVIYDLNYGMENSPLKETKIKVKPENYSKLRTALNQIDSILEQANPKDDAFLHAFKTRPSNVNERKKRHETIGKIILQHLRG